jgi:Zn-dependent peptidase ImmA (M78 family)
VTKPDDSGLDPEDRSAVEERAKKLLDRADAWGVYPTPIGDILEAAKLKVAPHSIFDAEAIVAYLKNKTTDAARWIKSAVTKVFGVYDSSENLIHIDNTVVVTKQNFLKLHETGHHELPTHRKVFRFFQDCNKTLDPFIADQFEREANNFARFALFQDDAFAKLAADCELGIKIPISLGKKFGASNYAAAREYARTNHRACVVYILEPIKYADGCGAKADVRRIECSPSFVAKFGIPVDTEITLSHTLGPILPIGRKMTRPRSLMIKDLNGNKHECLAEAFDTTWNVIILLYPVRALASTRIILPPRFRKSVQGQGAVS